MLYGKRITIRSNESDITVDIGQLITVFSEKIKNGKYDAYFDIYHKRRVEINSFISPKKTYGHPKFLPIVKQAPVKQYVQPTVSRSDLVVKTTKKIQKKRTYKL